MCHDIPEVRLRHLAGRLHAAGPRPVLEYLREIILKGADPAERLEAFAGLDPAIVAAIGADVLPPLAICVWGNQQ